MSTPFPPLDPGNAAVQDLRRWLQGEREKARLTLESSAEMETILRTQGRVALLAELLQKIDPNHRAYGT